MQPHEILEALTHRGYAPCLLFDDNGNWVISDTDMLPVNKVGDFYHYVYLEDTRHSSIVDAVNDYLKRTGEDLTKCNHHNSCINEQKQVGGCTREQGVDIGCYCANFCWQIRCKDEESTGCPLL